MDENLDDDGGENLFILFLGILVSDANITI